MAVKLCCCACALGYEMILQNQPVAHHHVALRVRGDVLLMRDHDDRNSALVELLKNCHDLDAGAAIEIAGRFVGKQYLGLVDQGACYGDALLLATGELAWVMVLAPGKPNRCKHV